MTLRSSVVKAKKKSKYYHSEQYVPVHSWKTTRLAWYEVRESRPWLKPTWEYTHTQPLMTPSSLRIRKD